MHYEPCMNLMQGYNEHDYNGSNFASCTNENVCLKSQQEARFSPCQASAFDPHQPVATASPVPQPHRPPCTVLCVSTPKKREASLVPSCP